MRSRLPIVVLLTALLSTPTSAHEDGVYESLGHIPIGRIFLTAEQRAGLDKMRGKAPAPPSSAQPTGNSGARAGNKNAAGFIVSDSGTTRVWKNGEFVATASASEVRFPGHVDVTSQSVAQDSDDARESDGDVESSVGVGDEEE